MESSMTPVKWKAIFERNASEAAARCSIAKIKATKIKKRIEKLKSKLSYLEKDIDDEQDMIEVWRRRIQEEEATSTHDQNSIHA